MVNALLQLKHQMDRHKDNLAALIAEIIRNVKHTMLYRGEIYTYESNVYIKQSKKTMLSIIQKSIPRDILSKCSLKVHIRGIIGNEYVSSVNIRDLNNEYYLASLCEKL